MTTAINTSLRQGACATIGDRRGSAIVERLRSLQFLALTGLGVLLASPLTLAQSGTITFGPAASGGAEAVPAMGVLPTFLLALLLGVAVFWVLRRRRGALSVVLAFVLSAATLATLGIPWVQQARGGSAFFYSITQASGESFPVNRFVQNTYTNNSGEAVEILSATLPGAPDCGAASVVLAMPGACAIGSVLEDGENCMVDCSAPLVSDRRLKTDISLIGQTVHGLPWYRFRYRDGTQYFEGVMAQDVLVVAPEAVHVDEVGMLSVNYSLLGLRMRAVE